LYRNIVHLSKPLKDQDCRRAGQRCGGGVKNLQIFPEKTAGLSNGAYQHVPGGKRRAYTMKTTCTAGFTIERKVDPL